jgi:hypothetical protein
MDTTSYAYDSLNLVTSGFTGHIRQNTLIRHELMVSYLKVEWHHDLPDDPVWLFSELDGERYEVRKVEVYRDGTRTFADSTRHSGTTMLGEIPAQASQGLSREFISWTPLAFSPPDASLQACAMIHAWT